MRITEIYSQGMEMTDAIRQYVEEKAGKFASLAERFEPCDLAVNIGRTTQHHQKGDVFVAEFNLTLPGALLRAEETTEDLYAAIDAATDQLRRQVKDYKEKMIDRNRAAKKQMQEGSGDEDEYHDMI